MTTHAALVGPLPTIRFQDGTRQAYTVPRDTLDPRYPACRDHRPACDCREAMLAEDKNEYRSMLHGAEAAATEVLRGHATHAYTADGEIDYARRCQVAERIDAKLTTVAEHEVEYSRIGDTVIKDTQHAGHPLGADRPRADEHLHLYNETADLIRRSRWPLPDQSVMAYPADATDSQEARNAVAEPVDPIVLVGDHAKFHRIFGQSAACIWCIESGDQEARS